MALLREKNDFAFALLSRLTNGCPFPFINTASGFTPPHHLNTLLQIQSLGSLIYNYATFLPFCMKKSD